MTPRVRALSRSGISRPRDHASVVTALSRSKADDKHAPPPNLHPTTSPKLSVESAAVVPTSLIRVAKTTFTSAILTVGSGAKLAWRSLACETCCAERSLLWWLPICSPVSNERAVVDTPQPEVHSVLLSGGREPGLLLKVAGGGRR
jgi:hypothetical protein